MDQKLMNAALLDPENASGSKKDEVRHASGVSGW